MPHSAPSSPSGFVAANPLVRALAPRERRGRGYEAEEAAAAYYTALGYRVLAQNWRYRRFEVDLILADSSGGTW
ncbi:MAG: YraN family protein, partial [Schleiferiaceae bacterium]